jgi:hypothetical protein
MVSLRLEAPFYSKTYSFACLAAAWRRWAVILDDDSAIWTIDGQPDQFDVRHRGHGTAGGPVVFHAAVAADYGGFTAFLARNRSR